MLKERSQYKALSSIGGFTLLEFLTIVTVVAIFTTVGLTQFQRYKTLTYCATVKADLRNLAMIQKEYHFENGLYLKVIQTDNGSSNMPDFSWSPGVELESSAGDADTWEATADHQYCDSGPYAWNSQKGGFL